jgi:hypothetical protein
MKSLEDYINSNFEEFNSLDGNEVIECTTDEFNNSEIEYLKFNYRFDYRGICVYYVSDSDEVWIENMNI